MKLYIVRSIFTISLEPTLSKIHRNFGVGGCGEEKGLGEKESPQPPPLFARLTLNFIIENTVELLG